MSDDELNWRKNVKPIKCEKVTLKVDHKVNIKSMVNKDVFGSRENFLDTNNRPLTEPVCDEKFLGKVQMSTTEYSNVFEEHRQALTTKLPSEIKLCKRSNVSLSFCLDYNTKSKVDRGKYFISDKLDLHGLTLPRKSREEVKPFLL
ncbi:hypothetical protein [Wolbachia endosymbiont of Cantharis cryptica]|uniref:hypothetical protein n=1 Tax=Wolbachia endosymbiont of Cantharis cryptica TaxID=3066132 RepID=UPI00376F290D